MRNIGFAFSHHNHIDCAKKSLAQAMDICKKNNCQLTTVRKRVLEILLEHHTAISAYEILQRLGDDGFNNQPPTVYRALDFLERIGLVHKIEALSTYVACVHADSAHQPVFLVCQQCQKVSEVAIENISDNFQQLAKMSNFLIEQMVIEAHGTCPNCQGGSQ